MVQVLPQKRNIGSQIGESIGQGLASGMGRGSEVSLSNYFNQLQQKESQQLQNQQRKSSATNLADQLFGPNASPQKTSLVDMLSNLDPKDQAQGLERLATAQILNQYLQQSGGGQGAQQQPDQPGSQQNPQQQQMGSDNVIPAIGKLAPLAQQQMEQKKLMQKEGVEKEKVRQFAHKNTEKYSEKLADDSRQGEEMKYGVKLIRDAIKSGKTGPTARNLAQKYLESSKSPLADLFASPESGKVNIGIKTLASGFKQIMGSKPTEREFFWYENILPSLVKNIQTNESIVDYFDKVSDFSLKAQDVADEIVKENSGYRPIDLDVKVREKMKPMFNDLISQGMGLLGESESQPKQSSKKGSQSENRVFTDLPDAKAYSGKVVRDQDSNKRYRSDGNSWIEVQ